MSRVVTANGRTSDEQGGPGMVTLTKDGRPKLPPTPARNGSATTDTPEAPASVQAGDLRIELVCEDRPVKEPKRPGRVSLVEQVRPFLEHLVATDDHGDYRLVTYPKAKVAGQNKGRLAKAHPDFEWTAGNLRDGSARSGIWVRWPGAGADE